MNVHVSILVTFLLCSSINISFSQNVNDIHGLIVEDFTHELFRNSNPKVIRQDNSGFIWIGAEDRLIRHDFESPLIFFSTNDNPSMIQEDPDDSSSSGTPPSDVSSAAGKQSTAANNNALQFISISDILIDKNNNTWVATRKGFAVFNGHYWNFVNHKRYLKDLDIRAMDSTDDFLIFVTASGVATIPWKEALEWVDISEAAENSFTLPLDVQPKSIPDNFITFHSLPSALYPYPLQCVLKHPQFGYLLGSERGLIQWDLKDDFKSFLPDIKEIAQSSIQKVIYLANKKSLLVYSVEFGLLEYAEKQIKPFTSAFDFVNSKITDIYLEPINSSLWITTQGAGLIHITDQGVSNFHQKNSDIPSNSLLTLFKDQEDTFWVAGEGSGTLFRFTQGRFRNLRPSAGLPENITSIHGFVEDSDGRIWAATSNGLLMLNHDGSYQIFTKEDGLSDTYISEITIDSNDKLWIATLNGGINTHHHKYSPQTFNQIQDLPSQEVFCILSDHEKSIWAGTKNGLVEISKYDSKIAKVYTKSQFLQSNEVVSLVLDAKGQIWAGHNGAGVSRLNLKTHSAINFTDGYGLNNGSVNVIKEDSSGRVWIGTNSGLNRIEGDNVFFNLITADGMPSNGIYSIAEDENKHIWVGTRNGLVKIVDDRVAQVFMDDDGLSDNTCTKKGMYRDAQGFIWIATSKGVSVLDTKYKDEFLPNPPIRIDQLRVGNQLLNLNQKTIELPYNLNNLEFTFSSPATRNYDSVTYEYKLEGFDNENQELSANRGNSVKYQNMPSGKYVARVVAKRSEGVSSLTPATIAFIIQQPFWRKWWFLTSCGILVIALFFGIYKWRTAALRASQIKLEHTVQEKTEELQIANRNLHDSMTEIQNLYSRSEHELKMAGIVQKEIILTELPDIEFLDITYHYSPMAIVSGDLFNVFKDKKNNVNVFLTDVSGHGISSGLVTMMAKSVFEKQLEDGDDLGTSVQAVNRQMIRQIGNITNYLTGVFLRFYDGTNIVEYANAAHPDMLILRAKTKTVEFYSNLSLQGCILGIEGVDQPFSTHKFKMYKDDCIIIYSDCILETQNEKNENYGMERFKNHLSTIRANNAEDVSQQIYDHLVEFRGKDRRFNDDLTFVVIRYLGDDVVIDDDKEDRDGEKQDLELVLV